MAPRLGFGPAHRWWMFAATGGCACALLVADAAGCAKSTSDAFASGDGGAGGGGGSGGSGGGLGGGSGGGSGGGLGGSGGDDGGGGTEDCSEGAAKFIYVVSDQNELYTFDPTKIGGQPFADLGALHCPGEPTPPPDNGGVNSMAVDRHAIAWVNFNDGKIFKVDTTQGSLPCTDTGYSAGQGGFTPQLGMGFATASATNHTESLYVSDNGGPGGSGVPGGGKGLGTIDTQTMAMTTLGGWSASLAGYNAELSGTGDGRLFGFFTTTPSDLGQIDKGSASVSNVLPLAAVNNSQGGYAFSFWGGDFWFYTAFPTNSDPNPTTSVTHYVSADAGVSVAMADIGFTIVGAGSSTCVPTVPPPPPK